MEVNNIVWDLKDKKELEDDLISKRDLEKIHNRGTELEDLRILKNW